MKKNLLYSFIPCFLAMLLLLGSPQTASSDLLPSFTMNGQVDAVVSAYPAGYASTSSGTLAVSMPVGSTVEKAFLYTNNYFSSLTPSATFAGTSLGSTSAFSVDSGFSAYKWDVTSLVTGSGNYSAGYSGLSNSYGMALAVVYSNPSLPQSSVILNDGALDLVGSGNTLSTTFNAFAGQGQLWIHTGADNALGETGEQILFNGAIVGGPIDANLGNYASLFNLPITAVNGINTATIYSPQQDQFGWDLAVLKTPSTAVPEPATLLLLGSGLVGLVGFRRKFRK